MMERAVFLDRDGTLNAMVYNTEFGLVDSPANPGEFVLLPRVADALRLINEIGLLAVLVSNQPGIAKGKFSPGLLDAMTNQMVDGLVSQGARLDAIYYCYHHPEGVVEQYRSACDCRKPKPGLLLKAAADLNINLLQSYMVGDGITDMQAGEAAGVKTILLYPSSRCYICEELSRRQVQPCYTVGSLIEAAQLIVKLENGSNAG